MKSYMTTTVPCAWQVSGRSSCRCGTPMVIGRGWWFSDALACDGAEILKIQYIHKYIYKCAVFTIFSVVGPGSLIGPVVWFGVWIGGMIQGYASQLWNCIVGLAGLPAVGPLLRHEAIGKQHLLVAGQTRQVHSSTKDPTPHQRHDPFDNAHQWPSAGPTKTTRMRDGWETVWRSVIRVWIGCDWYGH